MQTESGAPRWYNAQNGGPRDGYNNFELGTCDQAGMQIEYDVALFSGPYADCFDDVDNHGTFGLKTSLTVASTGYSACQGQAVTVSGRLDIFDGDYGRELGNPPNGNYHLDGNPLANRILSFTKAGASAGTATATSGSGNNWSKVFTNSNYGSYSYTVVFNRNANTTLMRRALDSSSTKTFQITWIPSSQC